MSNLRPPRWTFASRVLPGVLLAMASFALGEAPVGDLTIDCAHPSGSFRRLNGVNGGPIHGGETLDLSGRCRDLKIPLTRLHDCNWPNGDVVDIHAVFPDLNADPERPESYDFRRTDDYVQAVVRTGSGIVYRLGESIEHSKRKYHVNPPADPAEWASACVGIIRHYNEGWAGGFHDDIRYWEIWNEPENRPAMWTGTDAEFLALYAAAAKAIRQRVPGVRVGGPGFGNLGQTTGETLEPTPFARAFLDRCTADSLPLDFLSWHTYTNDPGKLVRRARAVRRWLDERGFTKTESQLNEWNYLPDNDWGPMLAREPENRQRWFARIGGAEGAAFTAAALIRLQDAPIDAANYYSADTQGFGLFNEFGVPHKSYYAMKAFSTLCDTHARLQIRGQPPGRVAMAAGIDAGNKCVTVLASNFSGDEHHLRFRISEIPWSQGSRCDSCVLDDGHDLSPGEGRGMPPGDVDLEYGLPAASVLLATIKPDARRSE
jgi:xylan 1,4-beta-xylosidase